MFVADNYGKINAAKVEGWSDIVAVSAETRLVGLTADGTVVAVGIKKGWLQNGELVGYRPAPLPVKYRGVKQLNIPLQDKINLPGLLKKKGLCRWNIRSLAIGNDDLIHILLAKQSSTREPDGHAPTWRDTMYQAVSLAVDWQSGGVLDVSVTDLGLLGADMHYIQRLGEGFLLVGARAQLYRSGVFDRNAAIIDSRGNVTRLCLGDGIEQCLVDRQNRIITSYFDEGVFGNYGWSQPIGACGLILWSAEGEQLWVCSSHKIYDCYAINLDEHDNLWFYYYDDFDIVRTNYKNEAVYHPGIAGSCAFLLDLRRQRFLFDAGYNCHGSFILKELKGAGMNKGEPATFVWNEEPVTPDSFSFRCSKALLFDKVKNLYYTDWILSSV